MANFVQCRCPGCGHIRGEAKNGSTVRLQCRQCSKKFYGRVVNGEFLVIGEIDVRRSALSTSSPHYTG